MVNLRDAAAPSSPNSPLPRLTWGTSTSMQRNTGKMRSAGRTVRTSRADRRVCAGISTAGRKHSCASLSVAGLRGRCLLSRKARQTHWSCIYCATVFPHPGEDGDSSKTLKFSKGKVLSHALSQIRLHFFGILVLFLTEAKQTSSLKAVWPLQNLGESWRKGTGRWGALPAFPSAGKAP